MKTNKQSSIPLPNNEHATAKSIGDMVKGIEKNFFIGRKKEIGVFLEHLNNPLTTTRILNIYGTGGVGKSYLIDEFHRICLKQNALFLVLDSRDFSHTPEKFSQKIMQLLLMHQDIAVDSPDTDSFGKCIALLQAISSHRQIVIALDTYEEMNDMDRWIREVFLCQLPPGVLIVIAGRKPILEKWAISPAWEQIVYPLPLSSFKFSQVEQYVKKRSTNSNDSIKKLWQVSKGHPLTLALVTSTVNHPALNTSKELNRKEIFHILTEQWLREVEDDQLRELVEIAAVVRQFDFDFLSYVMNKKLSSHMFDQLTDLSFIRLSSRGWIMHDLMRDAISTHFRLNKPTKYNEVREVITRYYFENISDSDDFSEQSWLIKEFFYHVGDPMIRAVCFDELTLDGLYFETINHENAREVIAYFKKRKETLSTIQVNFTNTENDQNYELSVSLEHNRKESELIDIEDYIALDQDVITLLKENQGNIRGLIINIPVNKETLPFLMEQPVSGPYFRSLSQKDIQFYSVPEYTQSAWYVRMIDVINNEDAMARSALIYHLFPLLIKGGRLIGSTPLKFYQDLMNRFGYYEVPDSIHYDFGDSMPSSTYILDIHQFGGIKTYLKEIASNFGITLVSEQQKQLDQLTEREKEVVQLVLKGDSNKKIAQQLFVSEITVKKHLGHIYEKLDVKNRTQLVSQLLEEK